MTQEPSYGHFYPTRKNEDSSIAANRDVSLQEIYVGMRKLVAADHINKI